MNRHRLGLLAVVYALIAAAYCNAQSVTVPVVTIDSATHIAVQATVEFKGPESRSVETDRDGRATVSLIPGKYQETITAPGYKTVTSPLVIHPNASDNVAGTQLEPVKEPEEIAAANAQICPGYTVVAGYAVDDHNQPVADVRIRLQGNDVEPMEAMTNYKGFFVMQVPSPPGTPMVKVPRNPGDYQPGVGNLTATKSGYKTRVYANMPLMDGQPSGLFVAMQRGSGTVETDVAPAWLNGMGGNCIGEHACDDIDKTPNHLKPKPGDEAPVSPHLQREKAPAEHENSPVSLGSIIPPDTMIRARTSRPTHTIAWRAAQISD